MRHAPNLKNERGIALAMAVFALVVIGAIVAGTVFAGRLEQRGGQNTIYAGQAFEAADAAVGAAVAGWQSSWNGMAVGDSLDLGTTSLGGNVSNSAMLVRVNDVTFLIRADGWAEDGSGNVLAERALATLAKLIKVSVPIRAALVARGDLTVKGTADLYGENADPPGWATSSAMRDACPYDATSKPSAEVSGKISTNGNPTMTPPPIENSAEVSDTNMFLKPYSALIEAANIILNPGTSASPAPSTTGTPARCNTGSISNWGEPESSVPLCGSYFPVIYAQGDLTLSHGRGQGILLVNGDLTLHGNFTFAGIIITKGAFDASTGTNNVYGTVMANNAYLDDMKLAGTPQVQFSTCAISRALTSSAKAKPFTSRAWAQLY
jgi:hypothetical protein